MLGTLLFLYIFGVFDLWLKIKTMLAFHDKLTGWTLALTIFVVCFRLTEWILLSMLIIPIL